MIRLLIKGDRDDALEAASKRGVSIAMRGESNVDGNVYADAAVSELPGIVQWYCEPIACVSGEGFPPGSLLFYREVR